MESEAGAGVTTLSGRWKVRVWPGLALSGTLSATFMPVRVRVRVRVRVGVGVRG